MVRLSPKQFALVSASFAHVVQRVAQEHALRLGRGVERARESVSERIDPRPKHRLRNSVLGVTGCIALATLAAGVLGRRKNPAPSPVEQAATAARETNRQEQPAEEGRGISDVFGAGASAMKAGVQAVQDDVVLGAATVKDAPAEAVRENVEAAKEKVAAVKENVLGKLVRVGIIAAVGLTVYILVMSVVVALIVNWIV